MGCRMASSNTAAERSRAASKGRSTSTLIGVIPQAAGSLFYMVVRRCLPNLEGAISWPRAIVQRPVAHFRVRPRLSEGSRIVEIVPEEIGHLREAPPSIRTPFRSSFRVSNRTSFRASFRICFGCGPAKTAERLETWLSLFMEVVGRFRGFFGIRDSHTKTRTKSGLVDRYS